MQAPLQSKGGASSHTVLQQKLVKSVLLDNTVFWDHWAVFQSEIKNGFFMHSGLWQGEMKVLKGYRSFASGIENYSRSVDDHSVKNALNNCIPGSRFVLVFKLVAIDTVLMRLKPLVACLFINDVSSRRHVKHDVIGVGVFHTESTARFCCMGTVNECHGEECAEKNDEGAGHDV